MAAAYYLAAHGAHFPVVHPEQKQSPSPPSTHPLFSVHHHTPQVPTTTLAKTERADSDQPMNSQLDSLFFRLPAELRNQIYEDLLCANTPTKLVDLTNASRIPTPAPTYPAILSTCKRIHEEAKDLLYTTHIFHAHPSLLTALPHLMTTSHPVLYPTVLSKIRRWQLTVRLDTDPRFTAQQTTAAFSNAEFLEIKAWQSMFDGCNAAVLKLFTGIRGVKFARVIGSVDDGLARWLEEKMMSPPEEEKAVEWCECKGVRYLKCEGCEKRVNFDGNGAGMWGDEADAWRFGNR
ncbi:hypothetical protein C7974DRAFT_430692 [Boeremia exigua]|uniref:uncharacterized protein n=1 Tax=Boeremia exigua TaxID=749465 RepID=UPI001E8DBDE5|nr:uncharacterized protein C7974DRAFT_430692 [Boeremia exigua]KAH6642164.1 hypothetical protein C7974DRAFT_430692 [Boeremia exigua]